MTICPSRNRTVISWPSTRLFTVTVLSGVTVPRPMRYTPISPDFAGAATAGMLRARGSCPASGGRDFAEPDLTMKR